MGKKDTDFLEKQLPFRRVPLLGGAFTKVDTNSIVGFCHHKDHPGYVTVSIMQEHNCVQKQCRYFERFEDYPYWVRISHTEASRQRHKEKIQKKKENEKQRIAQETQRNDTFAAFAYEKAREYGLEEFQIVGFMQNGKRHTVFFVSRNNYNDADKFYPLALVMRQEFGRVFVFKHAKGADGQYAGMIAGTAGGRPLP